MNLRMQRSLFLSLLAAATAAPAHEPGFYERERTLGAASDLRLRVDGLDVQVHCRIARHARERYMTMELVDPGK
jgi:hypothetical protein